MEQREVSEFQNWVRRTGELGSTGKGGQEKEDGRRMGEEGLEGGRKRTGEGWEKKDRRAEERGREKDGRRMGEERLEGGRKRTGEP